MDDIGGIGRWMQDDWRCIFCVSRHFPLGLSIRRSRQDVENKLWRLFQLRRRQKLAGAEWEGVTCFSFLFEILYSGQGRDKRSCLSTQRPTRLSPIFSYELVSWFKFGAVFSAMSFCWPAIHFFCSLPPNLTLTLSYIIGFSLTIWYKMVLAIFMVFVTSQVWSEAIGKNYLYIDIPYSISGYSES